MKYYKITTLINVRLILLSDFIFFLLSFKKKIKTSGVENDN